MMAHLRQQRVWALDTESDSLYSYYPKVCLLQISTYAAADGSSAVGESSAVKTRAYTPDEPPSPAHDSKPSTAPRFSNVVDYIVDPLRYEQIMELGTLLADPANEVIMHAANNDILILQHAYDFTFRNIFDTQLAARILGWRRVGLAAILEEHFDVISDKRMQRTNWGRRPLTPEQIAYAQMDTHYLPALRQILLDELREKGRLAEAQEAFQSLTNINYQDKEPTPRSVWSMKSTRSVARKHMGVLEALWEWREHEAQRQNRPPFKIVTDQALVRIAQSRPRSLSALRKVRGLSKNQVGRYGDQLLQAVRAGKNRPVPTPPASRSRPSTMPEQPVLDRYEALRSWRTARARARGVDPDIVFSNDTLFAIAQCVPTSKADLQKIPDIGPWKAQNYGADVLAILAEHTD